MNISKKLDFTMETGKDIGKNLTVYALSTCGFCKAGLRFLRKHQVPFRYLYVDHLGDYHKTVLKQELKETYGERPMYPFLVIDEKDHIIGFDEDEWYRVLELDKRDKKSEESGTGTEGDDSKEAVKFASMVAEHQGWKLTPDKKLFGNLAQGLTINKNRYGYYLCPCRLGTGVKEKDKDIICPCEYSRADIEEYGHCYCSLYQSQEFAGSGKKAASIPERRPEEKEGT